MCGIVGYIGHRPAEPILVSGLRRLEYRGYDSAGLATLNGEGVTDVVNRQGGVGHDGSMDKPEFPGLATNLHHPVALTVGGLGPDQAPVVTADSKVEEMTMHSALRRFS